MQQLVSNYYLRFNRRSWDIKHVIQFWVTIELLLLFLVTPGDSTEATGGEQHRFKKFREAVFYERVKSLFWFCGALFFSLLLGQLH